VLCLVFSFGWFFFWLLFLIPSKASPASRLYDVIPLSSARASHFSPPLLLHFMNLVSSRIVENFPSLKQSPPSLASFFWLVSRTVKRGHLGSLFFVQRGGVLPSSAPFFSFLFGPFGPESVGECGVIGKFSLANPNAPAVLVVF